MSRARDFLPGRSSSRSRRTGSLFGRSKNSDSMSIHVVTDAELGPDFVLAVPGQHKPAETPPRKMSAVLNSMKWIGRTESEERREEAERRASVGALRSTPPTSIYHGSEGRRRDRSADYSDASLRTDDSAGETRKKKERMEREREKRRRLRRQRKRKKRSKRTSPLLRVQPLDLRSLVREVFSAGSANRRLDLGRRR